MSKLTTKVLAAATLIGCMGTANADFVVSDSYGSLAIPTSCDVGSSTLVCNNFASELTAATGQTNYFNEGVLSNADAGTIYFTVYAWEAALENSFASGGFSFNTLGSSSIFTDWSVKATGSAGHAGGVVDATFCTSIDTTPICVANADNGASGLNDLARGIGFIIDSQNPNVVWLLWDDSGIGEEDDNHDDLIVRAELVKHVPEPATLGLLGLGLLGLGAGARRRRAA